MSTGKTKTPTSTCLAATATTGPTNLTPEGSAAAILPPAGPRAALAAVDAIPGLVGAARILEAAGLPELARGAWKTAAGAVRVYCEVTGAWPSAALAEVRS